MWYRTRLLREFFVRAVVTSGGSRGGAGRPSGVPNDDFLQNSLKSLFRLSRVRLDLWKSILGGAIKFVSVRST